MRSQKQRGLAQVGLGGKLVSMFMVRLDRLEKQHSDFKAFIALPDSRRRFSAGMVRVVDGDLEAAALFHVPDETDARSAVEAVTSGRAGLIER